MPWAFRLLPVWTTIFFALTIPFFLLGPLNAAARIIMHSGSLKEAPVLPPESRHWPWKKTQQALAAIALANEDLGAIYRDSASRSARPPSDGRKPSRVFKFLVGMTRSRA